MGEPVDQVDEQDRVLGVVERGEAIRSRLLHRIATIVCRDTDGRFLVHRRGDTTLLFPGQANWMLGGAVRAGESYADAAARELAEELGVVDRPRLVLKFLCEGAISPYWLGLHEVVVTGPVRPDPSEVARYAWVTDGELSGLAARDSFVADAREALGRYRALKRARASESEARARRK
ncbi:NUDIX domain-containing protein [Streptomyces sp. NPDC005921]|uniref:NUDIX hydrolase n=1 Tax=Streptomyces sp. NPDC005827 TaxID=3157070 RepID=UPI0033CDF474